MTDERERALREQLARALEWESAHVAFDRAVEGVPEEQLAVRPAGLPYSAWELLEHMRLTQRDILEFCTDPGYRERSWPEDYWPGEAEASAAAWAASVAAFRLDREELLRLAREVDLFAPVPQGSGQTYLRELLLVLDHTAYHVGELVVVRRLLGSWPSLAADDSGEAAHGGAA